MIDTRRFRYTGKAMAAFREKNLTLRAPGHATFENDNLSQDPAAPSKATSGSGGQEKQPTSRLPQLAKYRSIGRFPLTSIVSSWVEHALIQHQPSNEVCQLVKPFAKQFHDFAEEERHSSFRSHDIDTIERTYQHTLEVGAAILLAADKSDDPVDLTLHLQPSRAGMDDHLTTWGRLLTGLECDPPIIVQFPLYFLMCQAFSFEPTSNTSREEYVYSALTGIDWAKGTNSFSDRLAAFQDLAQNSTPALDDSKSGKERCYWRFALAYLRAMNECENSRTFKAPKTAAIDHGLDMDLVIAARGFDTVGCAYMGRNGAAWLDDPGMGSLLGSGLANDVMDLHTDIWTGETRNLLRLLYPSDLKISQAIQTLSTLLSGMLCEVYRGHRRARMADREDGRISSASPPYSFCRARHRRIFESLEKYINHYPEFWEWTWEIYRKAKAQVTEAGLDEPLVRALKRACTRETLPATSSTKFFHLWYEMIENCADQMAEKQPFGVSDDLATIVCNLHSLWHEQLLDGTKKHGWGREFDAKSDALFSEAGKILATRGGISEDMYRFVVAYGRLSMGLPYIAYHTVDATIMVFGVLQ